MSSEPWSGPLHAAYGTLLQELELADVANPAAPAPSAATIDALAARIGRPLSAAGAPIHFRRDLPSAGDYESTIARTGGVSTRDHCWHDTFNALVWLRYPCIKAAMNARHCEVLATATGPGRGPVRDALTLFDEEGLVLISDDAALLDDLHAQRWREAMHGRRPALERATLHVIGHALLDKARMPFVGLCAKVLLLHADAAPLECAAFDLWLAGRIRAADWPASPRDLRPLPVLGLPGMTPENLHAGYFDDARQFRPARAVITGD
ncbi:DUF3025 domain-containing protein [Methyloversatilis thermotolerans]|uniref:DUF3025 domain-containing protein n=1 Tax=Methyloversatilis thermotolerans TaxID=1346290 RepID=UPI00037DE6AF|nr:DUF3025 domain-containing protein [Methyloversatilis thermotolerans]